MEADSDQLVEGSGGGTLENSNELMEDQEDVPTEFEVTNKPALTPQPNTGTSRRSAIPSGIICHLHVGLPWSQYPHQREYQLMRLLHRFRWK
mgnify:CR=1 FL=1